MTERHSPRILITRLSHIGDCIQTVPVLNALRQTFPHAFIAWVVEPPAASLLRGHEALDELIVVRRNWFTSPLGIRKLRRQLGSYNFDITIDPQGLTKSAIMGWFSGAPTRIGFTRGDARELSPWLNNCRVKRAADNVVDRYLELLHPLGMVPRHVEFRLPIARSVKSWAAEYVRQNDLESGYYVINAGASWTSRMWEPERFGAVSRYLSDRWSLSGLVVWAGEEELQMAKQIVDASRATAHLAPPTSLQKLAALLQIATLYVGTDSGPLHLAVAMGTKCVSLHGTTRAEKSGPHGEGHRTVQAFYQRGSSHRRRRGSNHAMRAIRVADVCQACDFVLQRQSIEVVGRIANPSVVGPV